MRFDAFSSAGLQCAAHCIVAKLVMVPAIIVPVIIVTLAGCGGENWRAETYPVTGRITVNGQAAEGAVVTLHSLGQKVDQRGSNPWGIARADGTFALSTYEQGDGAPLGDYAVTVRWPVDVTDMAAAMVDRLGGAYANAAQSQWQVTIEDRNNELAPIEIRGAKVKSQQDAKSRRRAPPMPDMQAK